MIAHDTDDTVVLIEEGIATRDRMLALNGCGSQTTAEELYPCVRYTGCVSGNPVLWCQTSGHGHDAQTDWVPDAAWAFFRNLLD